MSLGKPGCWWEPSWWKQWSQVRGTAFSEVHTFGQTRSHSPCPGIHTCEPGQLTVTPSSHSYTQVLHSLLLAHLCELTFRLTLIDSQTPLTHTHISGCIPQSFGSLEDSGLNPAFCTCLLCDLSLVAAPEPHFPHL